MRRRLILILSLLLTLALVIAGCGSTKPTAGSDAKPGDPPPAAKPAAKPAALTVGIEQDIKTMDPSLTTDIYSMQVINQLFNTLVYIGFDGTIKPGLAKSWNISPDGMTFDFTLAENVKFHDGSAFTADDVLFTFQHVADPETKSPVASRVTVIETSQAVDATHLKLKLKKPSAPFLYDLATIPVLPKAAFQKAGKEFAKQPVGTGPFKFVSRQEGDRINLEKFADHFAGAPKIDKLVVRVIPEASVRALELETGGVDLITGVLAKDVSKLQAKSDLTISKVAGTNYRFWSMNVTKPPFDNVKVRQAVAYAIDRDKVVNLIYPGMAVASVGPYSPGIFANDPNFKGIGYDPAKAKQLLAEAGYPKGFEVELLSSQGDDLAKESALMVEQLAAVGITAKVKTVDFATEVDTMVKANYQIGRMGWTPSADPHSFVSTVFGTESLKGYNFPKYSNPKADELMTRGAATMDQGERTKIYRELQQLLIDESPVAFVFHELRVTALKKSVTGFQTHPGGYLFFKSTFGVDVSIAQ